MASLAPLPWGEAGEWDEVVLFPLLWGFVIRESGVANWDLGFGDSLIRDWLIGDWLIRETENGKFSPSPLGRGGGVG